MAARYHTKLVLIILANISTHLYAGDKVPNITNPTYCSSLACWNPAPCGINHEEKKIEPAPVEQFKKPKYLVRQPPLMVNTEGCWAEGIAALHKVFTQQHKPL